VLVCVGKTGAVAAGFAGLRVMGVKTVAFITTGRIVVVITAGVTVTGAAGVTGVGKAAGRTGVGAEAGAARWGWGCCFFTGVAGVAGACCGASNMAAAKDLVAAAAGAVTAGAAGVSTAFGAVRGSSGNSPSPNATESFACDERGFFDFCFADLGSSELVCFAGVEAAGVEVSG